VTVLTDVKPEVVFEVTSVEAEILIRTYVPEYDPAVMTLDEALALAELRDAEAAYDLEASITAVLDSEEDHAEDDVALSIVNALLDAAARADRAEREANGPWEVQGL